MPLRCQAGFGRTAGVATRDRLCQANADADRSRRWPPGRPGSIRPRPATAAATAAAPPSEPAGNGAGGERLMAERAQLAGGVDAALAPETGTSSGQRSAAPPVSSGWPISRAYSGASSQARPPAMQPMPKRRPRRRCRRGLRRLASSRVTASPSPAAGDDACATSTTRMASAKTRNIARRQHAGEDSEQDDAEQICYASGHGPDHGVERSSCLSSELSTFGLGRCWQAGWRASSARACRNHPFNS